MGALVATPNAKKSKIFSVSDFPSDHITALVPPGTSVSAHSALTDFAPAGFVGAASGTTIVYSGSDIPGAVLARPFAVDYASGLMRALGYDTMREVVATYYSGVHHLSDVISGSSARPSGTIAYNDFFRSEGYVLAGSGAIGSVFGDAVVTISGALEQLLGTSMVEAKPIHVVNGNISNLGAGDATYIALWTGAKDAEDFASLAARVGSLDIPATVDQEAHELAANSIADALVLLGQHELTNETAISLSDDGVLTIRWVRENRGALLIFGGEGVVTIATREGDQSYGTNYRELSIEHGLDEIAIAAIEELATRG